MEVPKFTMGQRVYYLGHGCVVTGKVTGRQFSEGTLSPTREPLWLYAVESVGGSSSNIYEHSLHPSRKALGAAIAGESDSQIKAERRKQ